MRSLRDAVAWLAAPVFGGYVGVVTLGGLDTLVKHVCPTLETMISPVVRFATPDEIARTNRQACFALHMEKLHEAVPMKYAFFAEARLSDRIPVAAYLVDRQRRPLKDADLVTHRVGEHWTRHYCFDLPRTIADLDIRVSGIALYRRHPFYDTPTPIPSFTVPAPTTSISDDITPPPG